MYTLWVKCHDIYNFQVSQICKYTVNTYIDLRTCTCAHTPKQSIYENTYKIFEFRWCKGEHNSTLSHFSCFWKNFIKQI